MKVKKYCEAGYLVIINEKNDTSDGFVYTTREAAEKAINQYKKELK